MTQYSNSAYMETVLPGVEHERHASAVSSVTMHKDKLAPNFPTHLYVEQEQRYQIYWNWYNGLPLAESAGNDENGDPLLRYPLQINIIRNFARKQAMILFGEAGDVPTPMIRHAARPKPSFKDEVDEAPQEERNLARLTEGIINEVWMQSYGRTIQMENAVLSQFLGGCYFQIKYDRHAKDNRIPLRIVPLVPDFVVPIWEPGNPYKLQEAYIIYRMPYTTAARYFGIEVDNKSAGGYAIYTEHWTNETYSIYLDGKPLEETSPERYGISTTITYDGRENPFGFVPIVYIPRIREGNFWGSSLVSDLIGLIREYNGRYADAGDAVQRTVHRHWFGRNLNQTPKQRAFAGSQQYTDLGRSPNDKAPPEIYPEDPPSYSEAMFKLPDALWKEIMRMGFMNDVAYGEDEGSQRSALTLAFRMFPTTSFSRWQRAHWGEGLNVLGGMILDMCRIKGITIAGQQVPQNWRHRVDLIIDWFPMIPRDREQLVNEVVLLSQAGRMSMQRALETLGDVDDVPIEIKRIQEERELMQELAQQEAETDIESPVATSDVNESL